MHLCLIRRVCLDNFYNSISSILGADLFICLVEFLLASVECNALSLVVVDSFMSFVSVLVCWVKKLFVVL